MRLHICMKNHKLIKWLCRCFRNICINLLELNKFSWLKAGQVSWVFSRVVFILNETQANYKSSKYINYKLQDQKYEENRIQISNVTLYTVLYF